MRLIRNIFTAVLLIIPWLYATGQGQTVEIARGSTVVLRADAQYALSYLWFQDGEPINGFHDQRLSVSDAGTYTVIALGHDCDSDMSDPVQVIVDDDLPPVQVDMRIRNEPDQPTVLLGTEFTYQLFIHNDSEHTASGVTTAITLPPQVAYQRLTGYYEGVVTYDPTTHTLLWDYGTMEPGQSSALSVLVSAQHQGLSTQWAQVGSAEEDSNPANNEASAAVEIVELTIPNVFTPNGDGVNDLFVIRGIDLYPQHRLVIFNRWGNEIYKSNNYRNDWDGGTLSEGTYYYVLEVLTHTGRWQHFKGFVTIIRESPG